jgi:hypothetical protein
MNILSRRSFLQAVAVSILAYLLPAGHARAEDRAALLVARRGTLGADLSKLKGMRVCAGLEVIKPESGYPNLFHQRGASLINVPMSERIMALNQGVCGALLFVSANKTKDQLEQELKIFFPSLANYEFTAFPTK